MTISKGDRGPLVELVQMHLNYIGSPGGKLLDRNGQFDELTRLRVEEFQEKQARIKKDGLVGQDTGRNLNRFSERKYLSQMVSSASVPGPIPVSHLKRGYAPSSDRNAYFNGKTFDDPSAARGSAPATTEATTNPGATECPWMAFVEQEALSAPADIKGDDTIHPRILTYWQSIGEDPTDEGAWCSAFANWVMMKAGLAGTGSGGAKSWRRWGRPLDEPRYGAVAVFHRKKYNKEGKRIDFWKGHVGFYAGERADAVLVFGGNQNATVKKKWYEKKGTDYELIGYRWPTGRL